MLGFKYGLEVKTNLLSYVVSHLISATRKKKE